MTASTMNELKGFTAKVLGVLATTYGFALVQGLIDIHATWGKLATLGASVLTAYGFYGAYTYRQPRTPWTNEQKIAESRRRIAAGEPPIQGYEWLIADPTATAPPAAVAAAIVVAAPPPPPPPPPPKEGA